MSRIRLSNWLFAAVILLVCTHGFAQVTISTAIESGNPAQAGDIIEVGVHISANTTSPSTAPGNFAIRVRWISTSLTYIGADAGELGALVSGGVEADFLSRWMDITAAGNAANANLTPRLMTLRFQVNAPTYDFPYSLIIEEDPDAAQAVLADDLATAIAADFDYSATDGLGEPAPLTGNVTISTVIESGDPSQPGDILEVGVIVTGNTTNPPTAPGNFAVRVTWISTSLTYIGADAGDLGDLRPGLVEGDFLSRWMDITSDGNGANANLLPRLMTLRFQVNAPTYDFPYSIIVEEDPGTPLTVLAADLATPIPALFDFSATSGIGEPAPLTGDVTISTTLDSGNPSQPGDILEVGVIISNNTTIPPTAPGNFAIRVTWISTSLTYIGADAGELGDLHPGPVEAHAGVDRFMDITSDGNGANANLFPRLMTLRFQVNAPTYDFPYSIIIGPDPGTPLTVLAADLVTPIPALFDFSATSGIGEPDPLTGNVTIATTLDSGNPAQAGSILEVGVIISNNTTIPPTAPGNFAIRVKWNSTSLTYIGADAGELGDLRPGDVEADFLNRILDITSDGNGANANLLPRLMTLRFQVNSPTFDAPYSIIIEPDPDTPLTVLAADLVTPIPALFDYSATTAIGEPGILTGDVTIATIIDSGNPSQPGDILEVGVIISNNTTIPPTAPGNFAVRVKWVSTSLTYIGAVAGELGDLHPGPVEAHAGVDRFMDVTSDGNGANANLLPRLMTLRFQVNAPTYDFPYSIIIEPDPDTPLTILAADLVTQIPALFDFSATTGMGEPDPLTGNVTIATTLDSGNPSQPGAMLDVGVIISNNTTIPPTAPGNFAIRVKWNSTSLTYIGADAGELGDLRPGDIEADFLNRSIDITSDGNGSNANLLPRLMTLHFQVNTPTYDFPYSIIIEPDPDTPLTVLASDLVTPIPALFDFSATTGIGEPGAITGSVTIATGITSGEPCIPGEIIEVQVAATENTIDPPHAPGNFAIQVGFNEDSVTFAGADEGELGGLRVGDIQGASPDKTVVITSDGNASNINPTPVFMTLRFQVNSPTFSAPYNITIAPDPASPNPLLAADLVTILPAIYEWSETQDLCGVMPVIHALGVVSEFGAPDPAVGTHLYTSGTLVTASVPDPFVVIEPGIRKHCVGFEGLGAVPVSGAVTSVTFVIDEPSTITWQWETQYLLEAAVTPPGGGSVTLDGAAVLSAWYDEGVVAEALAIPETDYEFSEWTGDIASTNNPAQIPMDSPKSIIANFTPSDPYPKDWDFEDGAQGWRFSGKIGDFSELFPEDINGVLSLTCFNNVDSFGFWYSPDDAVEDIADDQMLYRASFVIAADQEKAVTPSFRVRWNALNQKQGNALQIISNDEGDAMPGETPKQYDLFFRPQHEATAPENNTGTLAFDMINFNENDATTATVTLEYVELNRANVNTLTSPVLAAAWYFDDDENGWTDSSPFDIGSFTHPDFTWEEGALKTVSVDNNTFGFWSSPYLGMQNDVMYVIRVKAGVDVVVEEGKDEWPTMRVRVFDSQNQVNGMSHIPVWTKFEKPAETGELTYKDYYTYFVNQGGAGDQMRIEIDLVNLGDNSPDVSILQIDEVEITTVAVPGF